MENTGRTTNKTKRHGENSHEDEPQDRLGDEPDLRALQQMIRDAREIERAEAIQLDIARTFIDGERRIWLEVNAMAQQNDEERIAIAMYGIERLHIDTRRRDTTLETIRIRANFILWVRSQWSDYLGPGQELSVYYVEPQPAPHTSGQDMLHLIVDLWPAGLGSLPYSFCLEAHLPLP